MTNSEFDVKIFRLGACLKCQGDLIYDHDDWLCLQCGAIYYTGLYSGKEQQGGPSLRIADVNPDRENISRTGPAGRSV